MYEKAKVQAAADGKEVDPKIVADVKFTEKTLRQTGNVVLKRKEMQRAQKRGVVSETSSDEEDKKLKRTAAKPR